jgi:hypothetical protein
LKKKLSKIKSIALGLAVRPDSDGGLHQGLEAFFSVQATG